MLRQHYQVMIIPVQSVLTRCDIGVVHCDKDTCGVELYLYENVLYDFQKRKCLVIKWLISKI